MELSEEEKKAIEVLTEWKNYNIKNKNKLLNADEIIELQETLLNLIEKYQKEIEGLKFYKNEAETLEEVCIRNKVIPKSKIRNILKTKKEDYENCVYTDNRSGAQFFKTQIDLLEKLLESEEDV